MFAPRCRHLQQAISLNQRLGCQRAYTQGQLTEDGERQYFYYIDHQGMVSWDVGEEINKEDLCGNYTSIPLLDMLFLYSSPSHNPTIFSCTWTMQE